MARPAAREVAPPRSGAAGAPHAASKLSAQLQSVRDFYQLGRTSLGEQPGRLDLELVEPRRELRNGTRIEMLRKARAFADPERGYTEAELEQLLAACSAHGYPIGVSHVIKLVSLTTGGGRGGSDTPAVDKRGRYAIQKRAIAERWSRRQLEMQVWRALGTGSRRPAAGRRLSKVSDVTDAVLRLEQFCARWRNLSAVLGRWEQGAGGAERLPASVSRAVREVDAAVSRLSSLTGDVPDAVRDAKRRIARSSHACPPRRARPS